MLKKVGLIEFKNSYPKELSGKMAQRVSLIRTMISKPEIFYLMSLWEALMLLQE
ncbi:hypothetical protein [Anaerococcus obesiensis]|uniref:hypothetical protein n=1 Tax=Anaerococcus obesiensis TaxID=1287640 RepID=UPI001F217130|nr:hypothetical protein [Anaerococcus obesiensis]